MIPKKQVSWSCSVDRKDNELFITSCLISTNSEAKAYLTIDAMTTKIKNIRWEVYRTPAGSTFRYGEIPELIGIDFLSYSTRLLNNVLAPDLKEVLLEVISEGIRGVIQSRHFLTKEEGYPTSAHFKKIWYNFFLGSCLGWSDFDRTEANLAQEIEEQLICFRKESLFHRHKSYQIFENPNGSLFATANFADVYHEILLAVSISQCGQVTEISGKLLRCPYGVCSEATELLNSLIGKNLSKMRKKEIANLVGGSCGCTHIVETCYDLGLALSASQADS